MCFLFKFFLWAWFPVLNEHIDQKDTCVTFVVWLLLFFLVNKKEQEKGLQGLPIWALRRTMSKNMWTFLGITRSCCQLTQNPHLQTQSTNHTWSDLVLSTEITSPKIPKCSKCIYSKTTLFLGFKSSYDYIMALGHKTTNKTLETKPRNPRKKL